jgi:hypothetical protein
MSKLCVGGGDGVCHSSPLAPQGLPSAGLPYRSDQIKYASGIRYATPRIDAPHPHGQRRAAHLVETGGGGHFVHSDAWAFLPADPFLFYEFIKRRLRARATASPAGKLPGRPCDGQECPS